MSLIILYLFVQVYALAGTYTACTCIAFVLVLTLLQQLPADRNKVRCSCSSINSNLKSTVATFIQMTDYRQLLLIPLTIFNGMEQGFFSSDFTQVSVGYIFFS